MDGLYCCDEKFQKVPSRAESEPKNGRFSGILRTAYSKTFYCKSMIPMESVKTSLLEVTIHNPPDINGEPQTHEKVCGFQKFVSSILPLT